MSQADSGGSGNRIYDATKKAKQTFIFDIAD